ncbi:MAG TPA: hypothetical protein VE089_01990, partial [Nitrososphaeraceae archaeon]|nr:hypothetical protein [Nitrososphaeraceae archaeon]
MSNVDAAKSESKQNNYWISKYKILTEISLLIFHIKRRRRKKGLKLTCCYVAKNVVFYNVFHRVWGYS